MGGDKTDDKNTDGQSDDRKERPVRAVDWQKNGPGDFTLVVAVPEWEDYELNKVSYYAIDHRKLLGHADLLCEHNVGEDAPEECAPWRELVEMGVQMAHRPYDGPAKVCGTFLVNLVPFRPRKPHDGE